MQRSWIKSQDIRDVDSDFNFVTNQPQMVEAARIAYRDFPTVVNDIPESGKTYINDIKQYARMDSYMQTSQKAIGGSSDSAQLAQSYMWSKVACGEIDDEYMELYHNVVILAVLAQCSIDGIKRQYAVDPNDEITRIRNMNCMKRKKDFPLFMKYTHKIPVTKNGNERSYDEIKKDRRKVNKRIDNTIVCPMNYLQTHLDKIQGADKAKTTDTAEYFIKIKGWADNRQMSKIRTLIEEYDTFISKAMIYAEKDSEYYDLVMQKTKELNDEISKMKISAITMNRLIETCLGIMGQANTDAQYNDATKYAMRTFSILHRMNQEKFLSNFKRADY